MKKLYLYITKQVSIGFLLVTFSLLAIMWLTKSLSFMEMVTNKGLPLVLFIEITSCLIPRLFTLLAPIAAFVAVLFVYNRMLSDRELIVIKSAGISPWQAAKPAMFFGILLSFFCLYINNALTPYAEDKFSELEFRIKNEATHLMFKEGVFNTVEINLTIFINSHQKDGSVKGIMINDERKPNVKVTVVAENGHLAQTEKGPKLMLRNGVRQELSLLDNSFSSLEFDRYSVEFSSSPASRKKITARNKTLQELFDAPNNKELAKREVNRFVLEGHKRLFSSFYCFVLSLIACTGLLVGNFNRRGQGKVITISIVAMVWVMLGDLLFSNLSAKSLYFLPLLYANLLLPLFVCWFLLLFYNPAWTHIFKKRGEA